MRQHLKEIATSLLFFVVLLTEPCFAQRREVLIKISAFGALSGPVKSFGINSRAALNAAARRINQTGGVRLSDGSIGHFDITYADDHCKAEDGISLLRESAASAALAVIGPSCSSVAEPLYGALQHKVDDQNDLGFQIPVFTDGATKANLARISEWAFRNSPHEGDMYRALWQWVHTNHPEIKTVYAGEESDFAHSHSTLHNIIVKEAAAAGLQILGSAGWSINDVAFSVPAGAIKQAHADAVVLSAHAGTTCGLLKELAVKDVHPKLLIGLTSASTPETLSLCGAAAEGLIIPTSFIADTIERRQEADEVSSAGGIADLHSMSAWEILFALKQAIEKSEIVPSPQTIASDRKRLREAFSRLSTIQGVMGTITRTPDRESLKPFVLVRAEHDTWKVIPPNAPPGGMRTNGVPEEDFLVPFGQSGLRLFLRHLPANQGGANQRVVLFVHGATFPSGLAAAFPFGGHSWMQDLSLANYDIWALDFIGYGGSDRYPQMSNAGDGDAPLLRAEEASEQIEVATRFILDKAHVSKISIIAHSWGTLPSGLFATRRPEMMDRLVLFGPVALRQRGADKDPKNQSLSSAAFNVTVEAQRARFYGYVPAEEKPVMAAADMALWGPAYLASDATSTKRVPASVRVPSGPAADINLAWSGTFPYDPTKIIVPTLIVRGEWDTVTKNEDAHWLYDNLRNAPIRRDVVISRGTHVMHLEESRFQLYREVQIFLEGNDTESSNAIGLLSSPHALQSLSSLSTACSSQKHCAR
jgi:branched-chain amino acid transport system substrate-binding protein